MNTQVFGTLVVLGSLMGVAAGSAGAQTMSPPAAPSGLTVVEGDVVEGRVTRVDPRTRTITLDNGQDYLVPPVLTLDWALVRTGAAVKMNYNVDRGRNVATALRIGP
jgi:hypothetical protein